MEEKSSASASDIASASASGSVSNSTNKNNALNIDNTKINNIEEQLNKMKLLILNPESLSSLTNYSLNVISAYIISNPSEVLSNIFIYNCFNSVNICNILTHCILDITYILGLKKLIVKNKQCIERINKCISLNTDDKFGLSIQCSRRTMDTEQPHFFHIIIKKILNDIKVYIIDPYIEKGLRSYDMNVSDDLLIKILKQEINIFKDNSNITFIKSSQTLQNEICKMPQAITNDMSCKIWSILYQYIHLCSNIETDDVYLNKLLIINPFYWIMVFVNNIYTFYKKDKKLSLT